ncbi:MAG: hypothetical protein JWM80_6260, partial [Cyanobacteria bacterium RYN_339]|nr:hypothetical protein [Cyanobacteria bacterium RYN_339]
MPRDRAPRSGKPASPRPPRREGGPSAGAPGGKFAARGAKPTGG